MKNLKQMLLGSSLVLVAGAASAVADPLITSGITAAGTAFSDNFGAVFAWFVGIVVTLSAAGMLVKYIRRAK